MYQIHKKICPETFHPLVQMQLTKRRKNSIFTFVIRLGGVAQLVERLNGIQEVRGSTPLISTTYIKTNPILSGSFSFSGDLHGDAVPPAAWTPARQADAPLWWVNSPATLFHKSLFLRQKNPTIFVWFFLVKREIRWNQTWLHTMAAPQNSLLHTLT